MSGNEAKTPEISEMISSSGSSGENSNAVQIKTDTERMISEAFEISNSYGIHWYKFGEFTITPIVNSVDQR